MASHCINVYADLHIRTVEQVNYNGNNAQPTTTGTSTCLSEPAPDTRLLAHTLTGDLICLSNLPHVEQRIDKDTENNTDKDTDNDTDKDTDRDTDRHR